MTNPTAADDFFKRYKPEIVVIAAGKSGGIAANQAAIVVGRPERGGTTDSPKGIEL